MDSRGHHPHPSVGSQLSTFGRFAAAFARHPSGVLCLATGTGNAPMAASIDIAANCNLRCQHCYLYEKEHQEEGIDNDAAFLARVRQFRRDYPTVLQCPWVGGEPMWRQALLRKCVRLFPANWVVTNGTIPIEGEWPFTAFNISIDGTEDIHNQIRRSWKPSKLNVYQRAKQHANQAQVNRSEEHTS